MSATGTAASDLDALKDALRDRLEELAETLLGPPNQNTRRRAEWRWGRKGSTALVIRDRAGKRRGDFFSHEAGAGGSPLDLIAYARSCGVAEAIAWAKAWLGFGSADVPAPDPAVLRERARRMEQQAEHAADDARQRIWHAGQLAKAAGPITGTVAERYLVEVRKIPLPAAGWPDAVRFHRPSNALLVAATDDAGAVRAVQRVFLDGDGRKIGEAELAARRLPAVKLTNGVLEGAVVRLPALPTPDGGSPLLLAEGPETGLTAWAATGHETWVALGQVGKITPPLGCLVVWCRDDDGDKQAGNRNATLESTHKALAGDWRARGTNLVVVLPWPKRRYDGSDLNDAVQADGIEVVRERISAAIPPDLPCEYDAATLSLAEGEAALGHAIIGFYRDALDWNGNHAALVAHQTDAKAELKLLQHETAEEDSTASQARERAELQAIVDLHPEPPPHHGVKATLGLGKSHVAAETAATYIVSARAQRVASGILWTAPTLELADQTAKMLRSHGLDVGVFRGRTAPNPDAADPAGRMCLDLKAVELAQEAGANVAETVCGPERGEDHERCAFFASCPYQRNNRRLREVDVVVAAHNSLLQSLPAQVEKHIALTVIDEAFWQQGLDTSQVNIGDLTGDLALGPVRDDEGEPDHFLTDRLRSTMHAIERALEHHEDGVPISRDALTEQGLTSTRCREAAREQWRRRILLQMHPRMPIEERREAAHAARTNTRIPGMARLLKIVADLLDGKENAAGRLELRTVERGSGLVRRVLVHHLRGLTADRLERPILHVDGTMPLAAVQQYLPNLTVTADIRVAAPHMKVVQILSTRDSRGGFGKHSVIPHESLGEEELDRRQGRIAQMRDMFGLRRRTLGSGVVMTYAALEPEFHGIEGVATGHFNALSGLNSHESAAFAAVIGRPMPNPRATAEIVKQLFGRWVEPVEPAEVPAGLMMADGSRRTILTRRFENPHMDAVRRAIADDNVVQAIGRVRGIRRTAASPVTVFLLSDVVTPYPLKAVTDWPSLALSPVERMAARGVILDSPVDAARAYPDLFATPKAAEHAIRRAADQPPKRLLFTSIGGLGGCSDLYTRIRYRPIPTPAEPKPKTRTAHVTDPGRLPSLRAWLEALVGQLALFELDPQPPAPPPSASVPQEIAMTDASNPATELLDPGQIFPRLPPGAGLAAVPDLVLSMRPTNGPPRRIVATSDGSAQLEPGWESRPAGRRMFGIGLVPPWTPSAGCHVLAESASS